MVIQQTRLCVSDDIVPLFIRYVVKCVYNYFKAWTSPYISIFNLQTFPSVSFSIYLNPGGICTYTSSLNYDFSNYFSTSNVYATILFFIIIIINKRNVISLRTVECYSKYYIPYNC